MTNDWFWSGTDICIRINKYSAGFSALLCSQCNTDIYRAMAVFIESYCKRLNASDLFRGKASLYADLNYGTFRRKGTIMRYQKGFSDAMRSMGRQGSG